jgi:hypothetical protein
LTLDSDGCNVVFVRKKKERQVRVTATTSSLRLTTED